MVCLASFICNICGAIYLAIPRDKSGTTTTKEKPTTKVENLLVEDKQLIRENQEVAALETKIIQLQKKLQRQKDMKQRQREVDIESQLKKDEEQEDKIYGRLDALDKESAEYQGYCAHVKFLKESYKSVASYFQTLDTSMLSGRELEKFEGYLKQMKKIDSLKEKVIASSTLQEKMRYSDKVTMLMMQAQGGDAARTVGMHAMASQLGLKGREAKMLVDFVKCIYNNTSWGLFTERQLGLQGVTFE